jgi:hypothetical protein
MHTCKDVSLYIIIHQHALITSVTIVRVSLIRVFEYLRLLVQGHKGPLLCLLESS